MCAVQNICLQTLVLSRIGLVPGRGVFARCPHETWALALSWEVWGTRLRQNRRWQPDGETMDIPWVASPCSRLGKGVAACPKFWRGLSGAPSGTQERSYRQRARP